MHEKSVTSVVNKEILFNSPDDIRSEQYIILVDDNEKMNTFELLVFNFTVIYSHACTY